MIASSSTLRLFAPSHLNAVPERYPETGNPIEDDGDEGGELPVDFGEDDLRLRRHREGAMETARSTDVPSARFHNPPLLTASKMLTGGWDVLALP